MKRQKRSLNCPRIPENLFLYHRPDRIVAWEIFPSYVSENVRREMISRKIHFIERSSDQRIHEQNIAARDVNAPEINETPITPVPRGLVSTASYEMSKASAVT